MLKTQCLLTELKTGFNLTEIEILALLSEIRDLLANDDDLDTK